MTCKPEDLSSTRDYVEGQLHDESTPMRTYHSSFKKGIQFLTVGVVLCSSCLLNILPAPNSSALGAKFNMSLGRNKNFPSYGTWPIPQCDKGSDLAPKAALSIVPYCSKSCAQGCASHLMCSPSRLEHLYGQNCSVWNKEF